jgi:hypothetical protein
VAKFSGSIWLAQHVDQKVRVDVDLRQEGLLVVTTGDLLIGKWDHDAVLVEEAPDGIRIVAEGEELIFAADTPGFVDRWSQVRGERQTSQPPPMPGQPAEGQPAPGQLAPGQLVATLSLVLALAATVIAIVSSQAWLAIAIGTLAATLGVFANRGREWWEAPLVKGLGTLGTSVAIVAISLGIMNLDRLG